MDKPHALKPSHTGRTVRLIRGPGGVVRRANSRDDLRRSNVAVEGGDASGGSGDDDEDDDEQSGAGPLHHCA